MNGGTLDLFFFLCTLVIFNHGFSSIFSFQDVINSNLEIKVQVDIEIKICKKKRRYFVNVFRTVRLKNPINEKL